MYILIELLVIGEVRAVLHAEPAAEIVLDESHDRIHVGRRDVNVRTAEITRDISAGHERRGWIESRRGRRDEAQSLRRIAAIGGALVVKMFVAQPDFGACIGFPRNGRIEAAAHQMAEVAKRVALLVNRVQALATFSLTG